MKLYTLLKDRASINILKILSDNETVGKKYTLSHSELTKRLPFAENGNTLGNLESAGLVSAEQSENNGMVLSITQKGKDFVTQFDKLIEVMQGNRQATKAYQVEYDLTDREQKMLLICMNIKSESGELVELHSLAAELYPMMDITEKVGEVSQDAARLEQMNLIERVRTDDQTYFDVTETGQRVVREQFKTG